ncbi:L-lactate permease [Shigella flexneri]
MSVSVWALSLKEPQALWRTGSNYRRIAGRLWFFKPLYAAGLCLIVNMAPVAFGAMGIHLLPEQVTGIEQL